MIERRTTSSGQVRYEVRLRAPDGRERSRTFRSKAEAKAYEAAELAKRAEASGSIPARRASRSRTWRRSGSSRTRPSGSRRGCATR